MIIKKIAILGGGNGGATAAADIARQGYEVRWFELPKFENNLKEAQRRGGLQLKTQDKNEFVKIDMITTNISEAIKNADIIMLVIPTTVIEEFAEICAPHIENDQIILVNSAACMGSVRFVRVIEKLGVDIKFKIGETNSLSYGTRFDCAKAEVHMHLRTKKLQVAAYPSKDTPIIFDACRQFYEFLVPAANVWETTLNNGNPESHTGPCLLNAGRIEYSQGEFWLYKEGITEHTVNSVKDVDKERQAICRAMGFKAIPKEVRIAELGYTEPLNDLQRQYNTSKVYGKIKGPSSVHNRYFIEDISNGLVIWSSLAKRVGVVTPVIDSIITLGGSLLQRNFWDEGITMEKLGFGGMNIIELIESVN